MHIGIDSRGIREEFKGGVGEYTHQLLERLSQRTEHTFEILSSGFRPTSQTPIRLPITETRIQVPNKILNAGLKILKYPSLDRCFTSRPDLVFMPNLNISALSPRTPLVVTVHDLSFEIYPEVFSRSMRVWHSWINPRSLLERADHIIAVSESTRQDIQDLYQIEASKITVTPLGISPQFRQSVNPIACENVRRKYALPTHFLLYLGTIEPRKNIQLLIKAFEAIALKYPFLNLVIAGKDGWLCKEIHHLIKHSPLRNRIHRIGFVESEDKPALYQLAEIFIYPSRYEGFGFPPLEAMSTGTMTITSHVSSLPELVQNDAWKVSPYDVQELIYGIAYLLDHPSVRKEYEKRGRLRAKQFTWEQTLKRTLEVFEIVK